MIQFLHVNILQGMRMMRNKSVPYRTANIHGLMLPSASSGGWSVVTMVANQLY